jgi:hypothetical protein
MINALRNRAEKLCRTLAPKDLGNAPLYILQQSQIPPEIGGKSICGGFTTPRLDLYLQAVIGPAWQGRGPCLVVNDTDILPTMDGTDIETEFFSTTLHEFSHILERPRMIVPPPIQVEPARIQFEALVVGQAITQEITPAEEPMVSEQHSVRFIRIALHLCHRAREMGVWLTPSHLCAGQAYDLSHANCYREVLGDEPRRLAEASFQDILALPAPHAFLKLWTEDLVRRSKPLLVQGE